MKLTLNDVTFGTPSVPITIVSATYLAGSSKAGHDQMAFVIRDEAGNERPRTSTLSAEDFTRDDGSTANMRDIRFKQYAAAIGVDEFKGELAGALAGCAGVLTLKAKRDPANPETVLEYEAKDVVPSPKS